jgi:hypothetical protein
MRPLATNQTLTGAWANLGAEISNNVIGRSFLRLAIDLDINDSEGVQFKLLAISGSNQYEIPEEIIKINKVQIVPLIIELKNNTDQKQTLMWRIDMTIQSFQIQTKATTVGASAGIITTAEYELGYRQ